jgi:hypothetical protein
MFSPRFPEDFRELVRKILSEYRGFSEKISRRLSAIPGGWKCLRESSEIPRDSLENPGNL